MPANVPTALESIFNKVVDLLSAINTSSGYRTTVGEVYDFDVTPADDPAGHSIFIGVFVRAHSVDTSQTYLSHGIDAPANLILGIRGCVRSSVSNCDPTKKKLLCDIKQALFANLTLGFVASQEAQINGSLQTVRVSGLEFQDNGVQNDGAGAFGAFLASLNVKWLEDPSNP